MASMPSDDAPLAVYRVRTAAGYWLVAVMLFALAAVGGAAMLFVVATTGGKLVGWPFVAVLVICALTPLAYWLGTKPYRIAGGAGAIRFFPDRLELPGEPALFPRETLHVESREMRIRYRVAALRAATVRRGHLLTLRAGDRERRLSTLTVLQPRAFLADLERFVAGEPPRGPDAPVS